MQSDMFLKNPWSAVDKFRPNAVLPANSDGDSGDPGASLTLWPVGVLVHPGALLSVVHLLPAIYSSENKVYVF